jgi:plastocyanin
VPASASAAKGSTVTFKNGGTVGHDLKLRQGSKVLAGTNVIQPGQTAKLTLSLPPGRYVMFCSVPGHEAAGMKGTFTIK